MVFRTFTFLGQTCDNMSQWWPVLWQPFAGLACSVGIAVAVTLIQDLTPPESTVLDFPVLGQLLWLYYCFNTRSLDKPVLDLPVPWHSLARLDCPMTTDVALLFISHFIHWQPLLLDGTCPMTTLRLGGICPVTTLRLDGTFPVTTLSLDGTCPVTTLCWTAPVPWQLCAWTVPVPWQLCAGQHLSHDNSAPGSYLSHDNSAPGRYLSRDNCCRRAFDQGLGSLCLSLCLRKFALIVQTA